MREQKSALDQRVTDFAQKLDLLRWRRWRRRARAPQGVDLPYDEENNERQDKKINRYRQKIAVGEKWDAGFGERVVGHRSVVARRRRAENEEPVAEVEPAEDAADDRHG